MDKLGIRPLNIKRITSSQTPNRFYKKDFIKSRSQLKINKNYFRETNNKKINEKRKSANEEEKSYINIFNKTYNNKPIMQRSKQDELQNKINSLQTMSKFVKSLDKKIIRRDTSTLSKNTTFYKTKNRFINSIKQDNANNFRKTLAVSPKRHSSIIKKGRSLSAVMLNINNKNNLKKNNDDKFGNKTLGKGGFITALEPEEKRNHSALNNASMKTDERSYFIRKLKGIKKYLSYFDIQRILFFDKHVYKPDIQFEKKIYELKHNNSDEFIKNFDLNDYKVTILRLFQKKVSPGNYDILQKNFEIINKIWSYRNTSKHRFTKITKNEVTETEREQEYNQKKIERQQRIKEKTEAITNERNSINMLW